MPTLSPPDVHNRNSERDLEELFRKYHPVVYRTASAVTGNTADADDVAQGVFVCLLRRELPPELHRNPGGYFYRAAVNASLNTIRGAKRRIRTIEQAALEVPPLPIQSESAEEIHRRLYDALAQLSAKSAHVFILRYVHNYSDAEIAKLLGVSRVTIAVRVYRAKARLRKLLLLSDRLEKRS